MKNPFRIVISFLVVSFLGIVVIPRLPIDLNPNYNQPALTLSYSLAGRSPESVEQEATSLLENAFSTLSHLNEIKSVSAYNKGHVTLVFDRHTPMDFKKMEVISILRNLKQNLPKGMSYPTISQNSTEASESPLLVYRVNSPYATTKIKQQIDEFLYKPIARQNGVDKIDIAGAVPLQIIIDVDEQKADKYQIEHNDIGNKLSQMFKEYPLGYLQTSQGHQYYAHVKNPFQSLASIRQLILTSANGQVIRLGDIARVYLDEQTRHQYFRVNGLNSVTLRIYAKKGVNKIKVASQLKTSIAKATQNLPKATTVTLDYDQTKFLTEELSKIYVRAGLSMAVLILFILLSYRNLKHLVILLSSIWVTLCLTSLGAWLWQINIHLYTIAGITIAFGLVVDNSIVIIDQLIKHKNNKVFLAILAATGTTLAALSIIFLLPEEDRQNLSEFAAIISLALGVSLGVALWFTPALYYLVGGKTITEKHLNSKPASHGRFATFYFSLLTFLKKKQRYMHVGLLLAFGIPVFLLPSKWENHPLYNATVGSALYQDNIRPVTDKWLGGTLRLFVRNVFEKSGYRTNQQTKLYVNAQLPFGHTLQQMNIAIKKVENYLTGIKGIDKFVSTVYSGQNASVVITFTPEHERGALPYRLKARLIAQSLDWGGVEWSVYGVGRGFSNSTGNSLPGYRVVMKGYNYNELERQASLLAKKLLAHKRIQKVNTNERLSWDELSSTQVLATFSLTKMDTRTSPEVASQVLIEQTFKTNPQLALTTGGRSVPVLIKNAHAAGFSMAALANNNFWVNDSLQFDFANISNIKKEKTINAIHKENRQYLRVVGFDYYGSAKFGSKYLNKVLSQTRLELPVGYSVKKLGWEWNWNKTKRNYGLLFLLIMAIYFICSILFESFKQPLFTIGVIPLSFMGLFITFAVFDFYFDQGGYAAFILLGGLTVNAAIFIINDFNLTQAGSQNHRVFSAVSSKAKPILLTIASTCFGLSPFLLEGQNEVFWFSLAAGTIGGLVCSLLVVFLVLPVWLMEKE